MSQELRAKLIDTHCHLDFPEFDSDRDQVVSRALENNIELIVNIGSSLEGSRASVFLAKKYACIYATVGIHPHEADKFNLDMLSELRSLTLQEKVVAVGEIGLDYYKNYSSKENQKKLFVHLISLAEESRLPLVIHCREAGDDIIKILKERPQIKAVIHCFSGDQNFLQDCLALGFFISFTCNITYKKAEALRQLVRQVPLERLMLETDAPFLSPEGFRGKRNQPYHVQLVAAEIAKLKGISVEEVAESTTENAKTFFNLK